MSDRDEIDAAWASHSLRSEVLRLREERDAIFYRCEQICETIASGHSVNGRQSASWAASECAEAIRAVKGQKDE